MSKLILVNAQTLAPGSEFVTPEDFRKGLWEALSGEGPQAFAVAQIVAHPSVTVAKHLPVAWGYPRENYETVLQKASQWLRSSGHMRKLERRIVVSKTKAVTPLDFKLPFGKYKGQCVRNITPDALLYYTKMEGLWESTKKALVGALGYLLEHPDEAVCPRIARAIGGRTLGELTTSELVWLAEKFTFKEGFDAFPELVRAEYDRRMVDSPIYEWRENQGLVKVGTTKVLPGVDDYEPFDIRGFDPAWEREARAAWSYRATMKWGHNATSDARLMKRPKTQSSCEDEALNEMLNLPPMRIGKLRGDRYRTQYARVIVGGTKEDPIWRSVSRDGTPRKYVEELNEIFEGFDWMRESVDEESLLWRSDELERDIKLIKDEELRDYLMEELELTFKERFTDLNIGLVSTEELPKNERGDEDESPKRKAVNRNLKREAFQEDKEYDAGLEGQIRRLALAAVAYLTGKEWIADHIQKIRDRREKWQKRCKRHTRWVRKHSPRTEWVGADLMDQVPPDASDTLYEAMLVASRQ